MERSRTILHVDLDAFFVSCELLRHPDLRARPVVVAGGGEARPGATQAPGRAVVSAASYEARPYGVRSALPLARALALCPELVVLPVDISFYAEISEQVFAIFHRFTPLVEPGSLDEAYLDVTGTRLLHGSGEQQALEIQKTIATELSLPASVGVASSKTVAKVASDLRKPHGLVVVAPGAEAEFLAPLPVERLPGVGPKTHQKLRLIGVATLGDLARAPTRLLTEVLGPAATSLQLRAGGDDPSPVVLPQVPKSISREETYPEDVSDRLWLQGRVRALAAAVGRRLRADDLWATTVTLKLRFFDFETVSRQTGVPQPACADLELAECATGLLGQTWQAGRPVRLLGVGAQGLSQGAQLPLFERVDLRQERVDSALDRIRDRFGPEVISRGVESLGDPLDWNSDHLRRLGRP